MITAHRLFGSKLDMTTLQKYRRSWRDYLLLAETMIRLALGRIAIALLPFQYVAKLSSRPTRSRMPAPYLEILAVKRVRWAVAACSRRVPWRAMCFEQGLVAQAMLRRRGIPSLLHYGAAFDDCGELTAHVWVRTQDHNVSGCENAAHFALLATFPSETLHA
jgi:hypothetical protein